MMHCSMKEFAKLIELGIFGVIRVILFVKYGAIFPFELVGMRGWYMN